MDTTGVIQICILIVLLFLSGFFSSAETALTTVNLIRIRALAEKGDKRASRVLSIHEKHSKMLSTVLIGNNIVNISASSLATSLTIRVLGSYAVGITTGILTLLVLLFGEIVPKNWAMINAEKLSLAYSSMIQSLMWVLTPIIFVVDGLSHLIFRLFRIDPDANKNQITENELRTYLDVSHEDGVIESEEKKIIYNIFDFNDAVAKDIMIPRINMVSADINSSYKQVFDLFKESMYTRIPIYEDSEDNIIGLINVKDFLLVTDKRSFNIRENNLLRRAYYTYEYKKTSDLLDELREESTNVVFVLNEYGATVGMITLEDLLEEIVGEIRDEYDEDEKMQIQPVEGEPRTWLVEGGMKLDDINDRLGTDFDSEDYDSIGGLIIEALDRFPENQEVVVLEDGTVLKVMSIQNNRIVQVKLTLPEPETKTDDDATDSQHFSHGDKETTED